MCALPLGSTSHPVAGSRTIWRREKAELGSENCLHYKKNEDLHNNFLCIDKHRSHGCQQVCLDNLSNYYIYSVPLFIILDDGPVVHHLNPPVNQTDWARHPAHALARVHPTRPTRCRAPRLHGSILHHPSHAARSHARQQPSCEPPPARAPTLTEPTPAHAIAL
jgi:hypothetical protein